MNLERILSALAGGIATALLAAGGYTVAQQAAPPSVPAPQCAAVVENLAHVQAQTRAEADRCACKYACAAREAVERGWVKPRTRAEWDAICEPSDEAANPEPHLLAEAG